MTRADWKTALEFASHCLVVANGSAARAEAAQRKNGLATTLLSWSMNPCPGSLD
jgi:hypothetical protein